MKIIEDVYMVEFFRRPHSKRRRVLKKWMKRPENHRPLTYGIQTPCGLICHPTLAYAIRTMDKQITEKFLRDVRLPAATGGEVHGE